VLKGPYGISLKSVSVFLVQSISTFLRKGRMICGSVCRSSFQISRVDALTRTLLMYRLLLCWAHYSFQGYTLLAFRKEVHEFSGRYLVIHNFVKIVELVVVRVFLQMSQKWESFHSKNFLLANKVFIWETRAPLCFSHTMVMWLFTLMTAASSIIGLGFFLWMPNGVLPHQSLNPFV